MLIQILLLKIKMMCFFCEILQNWNLEIKNLILKPKCLVRKLATLVLNLLHPENDKNFSVFIA